MCLLGWVSDNGDPDNFLYVLLDKSNAIEPDPYNNAFFVHDQLHELLVKAQQIIKTEQRARLYKQAQKIIHHECPWVPLAHLYRIIALDSRVHGPIIHPTNQSSFNTTWIK
jgi:peptide/nickel transport system substrate-binding protein